MLHDHLFLGHALTTEAPEPWLSVSSPGTIDPIGSERRAFQRLDVRRRRIEDPTLRMALPTGLPGHID